MYYAIMELYKHNKIDAAYVPKFTPRTPRTPNPFGKALLETVPA